MPKEISQARCGGEVFEIMTIKKLICELKNLPQEMPVVFLDNNLQWSGEMITTICLIETWNETRKIKIPALHIRGANEEER